MARVYAIASAKGGVGKTTTTANLGATLADTGADVVVIDGDIGMANLGAALGVDPSGPTLHDVLAGEAEPQQAASEGPAGLVVVPGDTSLDSFAAAEPQRLDRVVEAFDDADFILIDVGAGVSHETSIPLSVSDAVVLVSTAERDALVDTEKTRQLTERLDGAVAGAVITRIDEATPIEEVVSGTLTANVLTTIPDDEAVRESIAVGEPLVSYAPHSEAAAGYRELARQLTGRTPEPPEPSPTDVAAETREALEESDSQLSESLSEGGVTIDSRDDPVDQQEDTAHPDTSRADRAASAADSDADHNVVNPFAASSEEPPADTTHPDQRNDHLTQPEPETSGPDSEPSELDPETESKWADAATGTGVDDSTTPETPDPDEATPTETPDVGQSPTPETPASEQQPDDSDSVPRDAIPFSGRDEDEATTETTVLGDALEGDESERGAEEPADDGPLIPDAEGGDTATDEPQPEAEITVDEPEESDDNEKSGGFFSRLFR